MRTDVELWQAAVSLVLIAIVVGVSIWQRRGLERPVLWATVRATAQLLGVGALFTVIFESSLANLWSGLWVVIMVGIAGVVVARRTGAGRDLIAVGLSAIGLRLYRLW